MKIFFRKSKSKIQNPKFAIILFCFLFTSFYIPVETIQIRIYAHLKINSLEIIINKGEYVMLGDGKVFNNIKLNDTYQFAVRGDSIIVHKNNQKFGIFKYLKFVSNTNSEIKLKLIEPERKIRLYQDNFSLSVFENYFLILNEIELDKYISGVVEAEAGTKASFEFYKVQAILARTFALAHIKKHIVEGFNLCDQVHCQAFFGKPHDIAIYDAVEHTKGKVVVDDNLNLIVAAFHSNSGGQTANSEEVWGTRTPYLRSIIDTFSLRMPHAHWERRMLTEDWLSYLKIKYNFPIENGEAKIVAMNFIQNDRKMFLECNNNRVPLKLVRQDLQLKSSFFNIVPLGKDSIIFIGKGYGHGLGMCQEGAMRMVKLGYNYNDILNFYYQNIQLIDLHKLNFFKDD